MWRLRCSGVWRRVVWYVVSAFRKSMLPLSSGCKSKPCRNSRYWRLCPAYTVVVVWLLSSLEVLTWLEQGHCVYFQIVLSLWRIVYDCSNLYDILYDVKIHHLSCAIHVKLFGELPLADVWVSTDTHQRLFFVLAVMFISSQLSQSNYVTLTEPTVNSRNCVYTFPYVGCRARFSLIVTRDSVR
jgi:hypothetical protein